MITAGAKVVAWAFKSSTSLRFFPQMRRFIAAEGTVKELSDQLVNGKPAPVALVEFDDGAGSAVWPVSALEPA